METHYRILGVLWIVYSGLIAIALLALAVGSLVIIGPTQFAGQTILFALFYAPGIAGGAILRRGNRWAKPLLLVLAVLNIIIFPIASFNPITLVGTALGIYTFWVLIKGRIQAARARNAG